LPALDVGGVERGVLEIAAALVRQGHRSIVVSAGGRLVGKLLDQGSEHITLPIGKKSLFTLRHVYTLRKILGREKIGILHARSRLPAWICYLAWKSICPEQRPRFVTTVHGPYTVNFYSSVMVRGERVIAISDYIRRYILDNYPGVDESRIRLIHRGVSPEQYPYGYRPPDAWMSTWQEQHPQLAGKYIVTLPARITRWKGHEDFIDIMETILACGVSAYGLVAGAPHGRRKRFHQQLLAAVAKRNLSGHIAFLGHRDDLKEIMAVSDVVLSLAQEPEAFGRTALEALCLGRPVIAYGHGGAAEILGAMFPAGMVQPFDKQAVVAKLQEFCKAAPVIQRYNPFTLDAMLQQTLGLYESIATG
ncbi:MAG: glycosyltransferase, partial [Gammaproteobacteria bacterium]